MISVRLSIVISPEKLAPTLICTARFDTKTNFSTTMCLPYMFHKNVNIAYIAKHLVLVMETH